MYCPTSLAQLPLDRKQFLVNMFYNSHRHVARMAAQNPRARNIDLGPDYVPGRWMFSLKDIIELCPPTLPLKPTIALTAPPLSCRYGSAGITGSNASSIRVRSYDCSLSAPPLPL